MNRTERLSALTEELRAVAPRPRSAAWLARHFEVSPRTIERDLESLRRSGVLIWSEPGRSGGYAVDPEHEMPALTLTASEALAVAVALRAMDDSPFAPAARSAGLKLVAALPPPLRRQERALAERIRRVGETCEQPGPPAESPPPEVVFGELVVVAVERRRVLHLTYRDRSGAVTERDLEPLSLIRASRGWALIGYSRPSGDLRGFLLDRIRSAELRAERVPERDDDTLHQELARWDAGALTRHDRWH